MAIILFCAMMTYHCNATVKIERKDTSITVNALANTAWLCSDLTLLIAGMEMSSESSGIVAIVVMVE